MTAADLDMTHGLVAGVWALVAVVALLGGVHLLSRPRSATTSPLLDVLVALALLSVAGFAFTVAVVV